MAFSGVHQLMARVGEEFGFMPARGLQLVVQAPEFLAGPVDIGRQCTELVAVGDVQALGKIPSSDLSNMRRNLGHRPDQGPRNGVPEHQRECYAPAHEGDYHHLRGGVGSLARRDAGEHLGLSEVDELVCQAFEAVGLRPRLRRLDRACLGDPSGAELFGHPRDDAHEPVRLPWAAGWRSAAAARSGGSAAGGGRAVGRGRRRVERVGRG